MNTTGIEVRELPPDHHGLANADFARARKSEIDRAYQRGRGDQLLTLCYGVMFGAVGTSALWAIAWMMGR